MRVLVIDDDPGVRVLCRIAFRADGDEVVEAPSGREGLEMLESEPVDAVILDVMMPSIDGFEVLRRIREDERTSELPVVLLSVRVGIEDQIRGWRAGADDYMTKPFSPSELAVTLGDICRLGPDERVAQRERLWERASLHSA